MSQAEREISTETSFLRATDAANSLRSLLPSPLHKPHAAIVCGSGLGGLQYALNEDSKVEVPYEDIPGMPKLTVQGHEGKMVFGFVGSPRDIQVPVVLLVGRAHFYEGHSMELVTFATRVCKCLDVEILILTNAAGGLNETYKVGDLVLLQDHVNLSGLVGFHPLRGPNDESFGVRFPALSDAYDLDLRRRTHKAWSGMPGSIKKTKTLYEGVYVFAAGPSYETRAECRLLRNFGADVVGMSTVPEVIVARHSGMRVLALSLVTNSVVVASGPRGDDERLKDLGVDELKAELGKGMANHEEVLQAGREAAVVMQGLIVEVVKGLVD